MKKFIIVLSIMAIAFSSVAQTKLIQLAYGAKGVDSLYGAQTKYYYVKTGGTFTTVPTGGMTDYYVAQIQAGTTRSAAPTGSDSCQITFEVSLNGSSWFKFTGTTPKVTGGAVYTTVPDLVTTTTNGAAVFSPASCYFPFVRIKMQHFVAATSMYPTVWVVLKKY